MPRFRESWNEVFSDSAEAGLAACVTTVQNSRHKDQ